MLRPVYLASLVCGSIALGGCIIDTVPTPEDGKGDKTPGGSDFGPAPDGGTGPGLPAGATESPPANVFYTRYPGGNAVLVVGREGAVPPSVLVGLDNVTEPGAARRQAANNGSFSLSVDAAVGDILWLRYWTGDVAGSGAYFAVQQESIPVAEATVTLEAGVQSSAPGAAPVISAAAEPSQIVPVSGGPGALPPRITVVVVNPHDGATTATVGLDGSFMARLPGGSGGTLILFAVDPGVSAAGGPPVTIQIL